MNLKGLLLIHAIITFAAGILLVAAPAAIPQTVNIQLSYNQYLLCYFLAAAEFAIAYLSFFSRNIKDNYALRIIVISFIVFHSATGILELVGLYRGIQPGIIGNIILRVIIVALFYYYGISKETN